jgi:hypothetical protein
MSSTNSNNKEENQQPTTNNQQPTTNNQQPTTNNQQPTTNNQSKNNDDYSWVIWLVIAITIIFLCGCCIACCANG